jgi:hypothetical protein
MLDDIADAQLDRLAEMGFDWIWFPSVWADRPSGAAGVTQRRKCRGKSVG